MNIGIVRVAREGLPYILALLVVTIGAGIFNLWWAIVPLILMGYVIYFFRDPVRITPNDPFAIISAADGKVVGIEEIAEPNYLQKTVKRVSIFLSIFDVHINRAPVEGQIQYVKYQPGKFHNAMEGKSSLFNENNLVGMENHRSKILVKQIAGMIARRIICYCSPGDTMKAGQKIGLIKFGSRVEMFMPLDTEILVKLGDKVKGGETIIGRLQANAQENANETKN
jgi:phosphatidylserine decarboxylase